MGLMIWLKRKFRNVYYRFRNGSVTIIRQPKILDGLKWIVDSRYGRAYYKGYYEPTIVDYFARNARNGDVFFDVGGHAGYFSFLFSRISPHGRIFTFEPAGLNCAFIRKVIELNAIKNIELVPKGAGSKTGELYFNPGETSSTGKISTTGAVRVQVISLDDFINGRDFASPVFMKIDVEGFGHEVIRGAMNLIIKYKPTILMEVHDPSEEREALQALSMLGYSFFNLEEKPELVAGSECRFYIARIAENS
ncbi:MAG TPA: FkbM family methyltransferase [Ohtaekwangia sp.]